MVQPGTVLQNRYYVLQHYKDGGHGTTFLVQDKHLHSTPLRILKQLKTFAEIKDEQRPHYERIKNKFDEEAKFLDLIGERSGGCVPKLHDVSVL